MRPRKSICIISFSPIYRDARVLRQIKYLSLHYDLSVIGYGPPPPDWATEEKNKWISIENPYFQDGTLSKINNKINIIRLLKSKLPDNWATTLIRLIMRKIRLFLSFSLLGLGRLHTGIYEIWYWRGKYRLTALQFAINSNAHAYHANDWESLPVAANAAKIENAKLVFDAHEYAPLELENRWYWKPLFQPAITYFIKKYSSQIDASTTVAPAISKRYKEEFGLDPEVILNAPERESLPEKHPNSNEIRLVHHGGAIRDRKLENLIKALGLCDQRFSLHLLLLNNDLKYLKELKQLADKRVPGRVVFHAPVLPEEIVRRISKYDIGICLIAPTNYNYLISLPNKLFDYVVAGLAVCVGPSPSMVEMINQYGFGCVASSFEPHDVAETLNRLTTEDILRMQSASREASKYLNAEKEMEKLIELYDHLIGGSGYQKRNDDIYKQTEL